MHELHYAEWGDPAAARVVVCAHGYSGNARDFDYLASRLAGEGARVLAIDFPGRGDSQWLSSLEYNFPQFLADARTLIAQLDAKEVDWIGTSMGGLLGMMLAAQASSPIRRLVMNDVGAFLPAEALRAISRNLEAPESFPDLAAVEAWLRRARAQWGEIDDAQWSAMARDQSRPLRPGAPELRLHYDPRIAQVARPMPLSPGLFFWDSWYRVRCPVLLLRGEASEVLPANVAKTMVDIRPDTQLVEVPGCGHVPSLMTEAQVALVSDFLHDGEVPSREARLEQTSIPARAA
jgi:pimeloyl-ACP methyl ester carboxylesterase